MSIIYLVGMMGSGKSTIASLLKKKYGYLHIDIDDLIESASGNSISEIFEQKGEAYFRKLESAILRAIDLKDNTVISTGGGTFCSDENINYINSTGTSIYLETPIGKLANRIINSKKRRPLIKEAIDSKSIEKYLTKLTELRSSFYERAHLTINTKEISNEEVIKMIGKLM